MINGSPKVIRCAINFHENLVEMPSPVRTRDWTGGSSFPDLCGKQKTEPVPPKADRFVTNIDATFMQKVLNITQKKRKPDVHHYGQANAKSLKNLAPETMKNVLSS